MITLREAQSLKINDKVEHLYLKGERSIWVVDEVKLFKSNPARVVIKLKCSEMKAKLTENNLYLWKKNS